MVGRWFFLFIGVVGSVGPALVFWFGGRRPSSATLTIGTVLAFVAYLGNLYRPMGQLANIYVDVQGAFAVFDRIFEYLDLVPDVQQRPRCRRAAGRQGTDRLRGRRTSPTPPPLPARGPGGDDSALPSGGRIAAHRRRAAGSGTRHGKLLDGRLRLISRDAGPDALCQRRPAPQQRRQPPRGRRCRRSEAPPPRPGGRLLRDRAGAAGSPGGPLRRGQDDHHLPHPPLLRPHLREHHPGRPRPARPHPGLPRLPVRGRHPGELPLPRHPAGEPPLRPPGRHRQPTSSPPATRRTSTT